MGYRCAVSICRNHNPKTRSSDKSVKYYQFPKVPEIRTKWISACGRFDDFSPDTSFICSEHFTPADIQRDLKAELMNLPPKRNLKPDVLPTLNLIGSFKTNEDSANALRKRKTSETSNISRENKENLGKSSANNANNGFIISYLGVPRLLITSNSKNSDDSKISNEGSQRRIISVDSEYASDIRSTLGNQERGVGPMDLVESFPNKNIFKLDELCRLCGSYSNRMKAIFEQSQYNYYEIISSHFPDIKIQRDDILPLSICFRCETTLVNWYQFYKTCNAVNKRFQSIAKKLAEEPPIVVAKESPLQDIPIKLEVDAMDIPTYDNSDDCDVAFEENSMGEEIEIVEITPEIEEADTVDVFPEEKIIESLPDVIPEEIEVEEKLESLDAEQLQNTVHDVIINCKENDKESVKKEGIECLKIEDEITHKKEVDVIQKLPESLKTKREILAARRRRRRRIPALNLRRMCHICGKIFKYPESLRRHLKTVHSDERPFKCHQCSSSFNRNHNLTIHIKVVHQRQRVYVKKHVPRLCDYCGKVLLSARSLEEHISSIHTKKALYECEKCGSTFFRKLTYDKHRASEECDITNPKKCNAPKPEESFHKFCEYCGLEFKKEHFYAKHKLKHMNNHTCQICLLKFENGNSLKEHVDSQHPEVKPFECEVCGKKFKNKPLLNCHLVIHTGEKRYQCPECPLKFLKKKYLTTHILVHTGERPFVCSICNKGFKQSGDMRKHKATHMRKKN